MNLSFGADSSARCIRRHGLDAVHRGRRDGIAGRSRGRQQETFRGGRWRLRIKPGVVEGWVEDDRLPVMDLLHRIAAAAVMIVQLVMLSFLL